MYCILGYISNIRRNASDDQTAIWVIIERENNLLIRPTFLWTFRATYYIAVVGCSYKLNVVGQIVKLLRILRHRLNACISHSRRANFMYWSAAFIQSS